MNSKMDLEEILNQVERPGRYLGEEWGVFKKDPRRVKLRVALVFPDLYEIGMSYLGQKILYSLLNSHPSILAERVYTPWVDFEQQLQARNEPLFSLENRIPLREFDILGFSLLYELNYSNILTVLDLGRIPLLSSERDIKFPLIIGGGPAVFNPEPVVSIFDLFLIGEGEEALVEIAEKLIHLKREYKDKENILKELSRIGGVYVPSLYETFHASGARLLAVKPAGDAPTRIKKRIFFNFSKTSFTEKVVVPNIQTVFDRVSIEVARGCPQKCRFCQATSIYFPYRVKNPSLVVQNMLNCLKHTGYEDASLASLSISDYPYLADVVECLMKELSEKKISLSLSSLRPRGLSSEVVRNIVRVRKTGFTLVPEAGTDRLRRVINKDMNDKEIMDAARNAFSQGWKLLKLYFMVGLPSEKEEDLGSIVHMVREILMIGSSILKSFPRINLSISSFIPKPHTPFQWLRMEEERLLLEKHKLIKSRLKKYPSVRFKIHPVKNSVLEAVFSRGDRRLNLVLLEAWKRGARFDGWKDKFDFRIWERAFETEKTDLNLYLERINEEAVLPWDHIDTGVKKSHLRQELGRALEGETTPSCLQNECRTCRGCTLSSLLERNFEDVIRIKPVEINVLGKKTDRVNIYRAFYSKIHPARFFSHLDLTHLIQRAFRRAGIFVLHTEGFHPKVQISYVPALPLGMEGKEEALEFKSEYLYPKKEFIHQVNKFLPQGVVFFEMKRIKTPEHSLNQGIEKMVYSFDFNNPLIASRRKKLEEEEGILFSDNHEFVKTLVDRFLKAENDVFVDRIFINGSKGRLYLILSLFPQRGLSPQKIIENIFSIKNPVYHMTREKILFKLTRRKESIIKSLDLRS